MNQIRISLTDEEKQELEQAAKEKGLTLSKYIKGLIFEDPTQPTLPSEINHEKKVKTTITFPEGLLTEIDKKCEEFGMQRSAYVTYLLLQRKDPIMIEYSEDPSTEMSMEIKKVMNNLNYLSQAAEQSNGKLYDSEIRALSTDLKDLYQEMLKAITGVKKMSRKNYKQFLSEIYREKK